MISFKANNGAWKPRALSMIWMMMMLKLMRWCCNGTFHDWQSQGRGIMVRPLQLQIVFILVVNFEHLEYDLPWLAHDHP